MVAGRLSSDIIAGMIITYEGVEFFKIQYGDTVLALGPVSKESKQKSARFGADIVLISTNHPDTNGAESVSFGDKKPFIIRGPGEYELKGVTIRGFAGETAYGGEKLSNTLYLIDMEGMTLCYLGALNTKELSKEANESIDNVDVLFLPVGGDGVLSAADAYGLAVSIEPKIIIPMHYGSVGQKNALNLFLKEGGGADEKPTDKLVIKKKDLEGKEGDIVVINPQN